MVPICSLRRISAAYGTGVTSVLTPW